MSDGRLVEVIRRYVRGCNAGDVALLETCFASDVRVYFVHQGPVTGRKEVAHFWREFQAATKAYWTIDHTVAVDGEVVVEWSVRWTPPGAEKPTIMRGTDWFTFIGEQMSEIRQYYDVRGLVPDSQAYELQGFDYVARGYPTLQSILHAKPS